MNKITSFGITGLFGNRDVELDVIDDVLILVGPNGAGKSTVINIFYFFITRQWDRLLEYDFKSISIRSDGSEVRASRERIFGLQRISRAISEINPDSRAGRLLDRLRESNQLEEFFLTAPDKPSTRRKYAELLSVSLSEVHHFHNYLARRAPDDADSDNSPRVALEHSLETLLSGRVLYLPTYRRIEKDLKEIFPGLEESVRRYGIAEMSSLSARASTHYVDLVSFGMGDVKANVHKRMSEMRDYSLKQYNDLSATYLRDVIRGQGDSFIAKDLNGLTEQRITQILDRVDEAALPQKDKALLLRKVKQIQQKRKSDIAVSDKFLAHYFSRLVAVNADIAARERDITAFVEVCNAYLRPSKRMIYDEIGFSLKIEDDRGGEIFLSSLSSGEKQIVSIFSHLYLGESTQQTVIIDEPELSLSVPWQKRFLRDIMDSGKCSLLLAVTHSPFIYEESFRNSTVDLRRKTSVSAG